MLLRLHSSVVPGQTTCFCVKESLGFGSHKLVSGVTAASDMQMDGANQELWLVDGQPGPEDAHSMVASLAAELGGAWRHQAEQQSKYSLKMEYLEQVITPMTPVVA